MMYHPTVENKTFSIVSESYPHLQKGAMFDFFNILKKDNIYNSDSHNISQSTYKINTNILQFFSVEDESKVRGPRRDFLFVNEANNIKFDTFRQLNMRTLCTTFIDFNPVAEFWAHQLLGQPNVEYIHSTYKDNRFTPQKVVDEIERLKDIDPNWYRIYALGEIGSTEGLVFNNWKIINNFPINLEKVRYSIDFGFTNDPSTVICMFKQNGELYVDEVIYGIGMTNADISDAMSQHGLRKHYDEIYADSAEPKSIDELYKRGWNIKPSIKGPDSILKGIDLLKQYKINVSSRSLNLIKELRNYSWMKDKDGKYINKPVGACHCIDPMRYILQSTENKRTAKFSII